MSFELHAPDQITVGTPISFRFSSPTRISGRLRLTAGTESVPFRLERSPDEISEPAPSHRIRGKDGEFRILDWGEHPEGSELVLRFEGRKVWMTVVGPDAKTRPSTRYDVFNGDADGICALTQYRLATPADAVLVTGVKRDISLLDRVEAAPGDEVVVLDVSLDKNRAGLLKVLEQGARVFYADHHFAGEIPESDRLTTAIDTAADVCTSLLVHKHIGGRYPLWAITGAFGDNLDKSAQALAKGKVEGDELETLKNLGIYLNYNGYGSSIEDLHFAPADLYRRVSRFESPLDFVTEDPDTFSKLQNGYNDDMAAAQSAKPVAEPGDTAVYILPDAPWARRVSGVFSNGLARANQSRAHAVLTERGDGAYLVSVRAPLDNKTGADELCRSFPTGGGRKAAAGINNLPEDQLDVFIDRFNSFYAR